MNSWYRWENRDLILQLKIQPRAARNEFSGPLNDAYKVRITAPPVDGKANHLLLSFLAKSFGVTKSSISIENGEAARYKRVRITNPSVLPIPQIDEPTA